MMTTHLRRNTSVWSLLPFGPRHAQFRPQVLQVNRLAQHYLPPSLASAATQHPRHRLNPSVPRHRVGLAAKANTWHLEEKGANFTATARRSAEPLLPPLLHYRHTHIWVRCVSDWRAGVCLVCSNQSVCVCDTQSLHTDTLQNRSLVWRHLQLQYTRSANHNSANSTHVYRRPASDFLQGPSDIDAFPGCVLPFPG